GPLLRLPAEGPAIPRDWALARGRRGAPDPSLGLPLIAWRLNAAGASDLQRPSDDSGRDPPPISAEAGRRGWLPHGGIQHPAVAAEEAEAHRAVRSASGDESVRRR